MIEILVIDDDRGILDVVRKALSREGYSVTVLDDPLKLDEGQLGRYQLILLDVMMPGTDGFSLCRRIRDQVDCPILFLTAKTEEKDMIKLQECVKIINDEAFRPRGAAGEGGGPYPAGEPGEKACCDHRRRALFHAGTQSLVPGQGDGPDESGICHL